MADDTPHFDPEDTEVTGDEDDEDETGAIDDPFMTGSDAAMLGEMSQGPLGWGPKSPEAEMPYVEEDLDDDKYGQESGGDYPQVSAETEALYKQPVVYNFRYYPDLTTHPGIFALEDWTEWLVWHFELGEIVPACWPQHPAMAEELAALYEAWDTIYNGPNNNQGAFDQLTWLSQLDASLQRIHGRWDRSDCGSSGAHPAERVRSVWPGMKGNPEDLDYVGGLTQSGRVSPTPEEQGAPTRGSNPAYWGEEPSDIEAPTISEKGAQNLAAALWGKKPAHSDGASTDSGIAEEPERDIDPF